MCLRYIVLHHVILNYIMSYHIIYLNEVIVTHPKEHVTVRTIAMDRSSLTTQRRRVMCLQHAQIASSNLLILFVKISPDLVGPDAIFPHFLQVLVILRAILAQCKHAFTITVQ